MAIMMARDRATARDAAQSTDRGDQEPIRGRVRAPGAMPLQSSRGHEATPQAFVRLTGSHLARPGGKRITE